MRRWIIATSYLLLLTSYFWIAPTAQSMFRRPHQFPRTANLYLKWHLSESEARALAQSWDVIVLDMEVAENSRRELELIRQLNPKAKILAYITSQEVRQDIAVNPQAPLRRRLAVRLPDAWYLHSASGARVQWWPQTWLVNITDQTPAVDGRRWSETLASFVTDEIASSGLWDGVFYDNLWGGVAWFDRDTIDINGDGQIEDPATRDRLWTDGVRAMLRATRARVPAGFLITGNGSPIYSEDTNGLLLEHFPSTSEGDWSKSMAAYQSILARAAAPVLAILNSNTDNTGAWKDWRRMRFGLTSTLLGNGYFSFDFGDQEHAQLWSYDEYDVYLGEPKGAARTIGSSVGGQANPTFPQNVYRRDFERGLVLVNATDAQQTITFDEEFERVHGVQDPVANDGTIVSDVMLPPQDGLILLRPIAGVSGAPFTNGAFARVFRPDGSTARTGFFAYDGAFRGGTMIETSDFDHDGKLEVVVADQSAIRVLRDGVELRSFQPFGPSFTGGIAFAIGDLDRNGTWEIVVAPKSGGRSVGIFNLFEGRLLSPMFAPFGPSYRGGMSVALMDRDGDGAPDIVVGAGSGQSPIVRVVDQRGRAIGKSFLAFDQKFYGGVRVASGDVDGDGRDEIIVGAGPSGGPHIRIFTADGKLVRQFFAFDASRRGGVDVAVADLDGDGRLEILGMSTQAFTIASDKYQGISDKSSSP